MQTIDYGPKPFDQFVIAILEFTEFLSLFLENNEEGIRGVTVIDPGGKWVVDEIFPSLLSVLGQGGIQEGFEVRGGGGCIMS